jgi:hypothetical protein
MSASQILLAGHGQEDQWLSYNPDRTYFEAKYQPRVNRSRETYEIPFDSQDTTFGSTGRCTIPVKGDYMTRLTLRTVLPPIYPTVPGQYVYPTPSSQVGATVYVNKVLDLVVADGATLTANTVGSHYFSIGAQVSLAGTAYVIFDLDGTYTITGIPTANSFTCSTTLAGISYNGTVSSPGIQCGDIISYFSTANSNLWVNNLTNKTWQITGGSVIGSTWTFTTSAPSNFPIGSQVVLNLPSSGILNQISTVSASIDTSFTCTIINNGVFCACCISSPSPGDTNQTVYSLTGGQSWSTPYNLSTSMYGIAYGNGVFVAVGDQSVYSTDGGHSWTSVSLTGFYYSVTYGNGIFVAVGDDTTAYSSNDGQSWTVVSLSGFWKSVIYANGIFVAVGNNTTAYSSNGGQSWTVVSLSGFWRGVAYDGTSRLVAVSTDSKSAYSTNDGQTWSSPLSTGVTLGSIAYGNGKFVAVGGSTAVYSSDGGQSWTNVPLSISAWSAIAYGNGTFVAVSPQRVTMYSTNGGQTWSTPLSTVVGYWTCVAFGIYPFFSSSDSVSLAISPLQWTNRVFSSSVYPSISFSNAADAAFWGFDSREGLTYDLPATPPWTLTQSGWISGFLPPSTSTYDDSVAHKLCKAVRILVGKQTIKEYSGEYIELQNDLLVPYENKAILKLMNGTLDQTQATVAREYYVNLPLGTKEVPLCALTHQNMSVEIDFDSYLNVSQNLNQGTGDFLDAKSYTTYDASTGLLNGQPVNVQTTFSYQQYIFIVTYGGQFIIFDTTKNVDDPASYIVLSAFSGSNLFKQFCVLSGNLYIGLSDGTLARIIITELIQGNISSFSVNNYTPTTGSLTGTIVADFRYVYYTVSKTSSSNVFMTKYDTTGVFTNAASYTAVDFTHTFNSAVTGVYQTLSTGTELVMLPQGTPGNLYTYQLNANVQTQWYVLDYSSYMYQISDGVVIGNAVYFVGDGFGILKYSNSQFTSYLNNFLNGFMACSSSSQNARTVDGGQSWQIFAGGGEAIACGINGNFVTVAPNYSSYSLDYGKTWSPAAFMNGGYTAVAYGNGSFVAVAYDNIVGYSTNDGQTWTEISVPGFWYGIVYANGRFVAVGYNVTGYSTNGGQSWTTVSLTGSWKGIAYDGTSRLVAVSYDNLSSYSTDGGQTWSNPTSTVVSGTWRALTYGEGKFVAVGGVNTTAYSSDGGQSWVTGYNGSGVSVKYRNGLFVAVINNNSYYSSDGIYWSQSYISNALYGGVDYFTSQFTIPGYVFKNLIAVGNYIYCSTSNVAVQIDTTQDLSTAAAYKFPAPLPDNQYVLANGPRYVYMFAQGDNTATNIFEFDPYGPDTTFKASILVDYESLPNGTNKPDKALLGLVQTQKVTDMTHMDIKGPVKELWVTGASDSANVFQYSNLATRSTLSLAGEKIVTDDDGTHTFLNVIEPFETHTSMPIRNVSVVSFEFDPESSVPNGTINFSRIRDQVFDGNAQTVWASNYNLLAIQGGIGGLIFNS